MRRALLLPLLAACKQVFGLQDPERPGDASVDAVDVDAPDARRVTCMERWFAGPTFSTPQLISELAGIGNEGDPSLTSDGLTIYFQRGGDIHTSTRTSPQAAWPVPMIDPQLSSPAGETKVTLSSDHTRGYIATTRPGGQGGVDIWRLLRTDTQTPWSFSQIYMEDVNASGDQHDPHLNVDWLRLYLAVPVNTQSIAVASRPDTGSSFSAPVVVSELDGANASEADPTLTNDERVIVFTSLTAGVRRLMYATRPTALASFSQPQELTTLNAGVGGGDGDAMITGDGCTLYYSSYRSGAGDLYVTELQ